MKRRKSNEATSKEALRKSAAGIIQRLGRKSEETVWGCS